MKQNICDGKEINLKQFEIIDKSIDKHVNMIAKILEKKVDLIKQALEKNRNSKVC